MLPSYGVQALPAAAPRGLLRMAHALHALHCTALHCTAPHRTALKAQCAGWEESRLTGQSRPPFMVRLPAAGRRTTGTTGYTSPPGCFQEPKRAAAGCTAGRPQTIMKRCQFAECAWRAASGYVRCAGRVEKVPGSSAAEDDHRDKFHVLPVEEAECGSSLGSAARPGPASCFLA
jgi:hypothetical protein